VLRRDRGADRARGGAAGGISAGLTARKKRVWNRQGAKSAKKKTMTLLLPFLGSLRFAFRARLFWPLRHRAAVSRTSRPASQWILWGLCGGTALA
jgi:hypothetical protein